ncbi:hypothetical protein P170DRAFT_440081 [Aspergillus steynii IBT 23096]|uniref:Nucleoside-diphosphate-sugar epimerase n=1 Tax=Aspergillus steynii IBT 23096 TaxID=1392250 RepID=A0A2I2FW47_9EURO|nr:uncharacterized protein P170DRAFT_440081 [Aspergillus steynii IBT 23096]PLB44869.1 hypothetical protein P170DRAFT_440081 [Aspergillus steynii IBT 23096]
MRLILTGATGLVGSAILNHILSLPPGEISRLYILSRSPVPMAEGKPNVTVIEHKDFSEYSPELMEQLKGADGCIWAQGISQTQVSKEEYVKITLDYPLAAAKAFAGLSDKFNFVYVSGEGATQTPGFLTPLFGRTKGQCEAALIDLSKKYPSLRPYSVRPAYVDPAFDPQVLKHVLQRPDQQTLGKTLLRRFGGPPFRAFLADHVSPTKDLGGFLTKLARGDGKPMSGEGVSGDGWIVSNVAFRREAGL